MNSRMTTLETARMLNVGVDTVRYGLQSEIYPFGVAIKMPSGRYVYDIRRDAVERYMKVGVRNDM